MWNLKKLTAPVDLAVGLCGSSAAACQGCDLSGADLSAGFFSSEVNLSGANLEKAILKEADLLWASLASANLNDADLREANLSGDFALKLNAIFNDVILCNTQMPWGEENIHCR